MNGCYTPNSRASLFELGAHYGDWEFAKETSLLYSARTEQNSSSCTLRLLQSAPSSTLLTLHTLPVSY